MALYGFSAVKLNERHQIENDQRYVDEKKGLVFSSVGDNAKVSFWESPLQNPEGIGKRMTNRKLITIQKYGQMNLVDDMHTNSGV